MHEITNGNSVWLTVHAAGSLKTRGQCRVHIPPHTPVQVYQDGFILMVETHVGETNVSVCESDTVKFT